MTILRSYLARLGAWALILFASLPSWSANYEVKVGRQLNPLQRLDCCNHDSFYLEMDQNGGIWFWKYGKRTSSLINSGQISRQVNSTRHSYYMEVEYGGRIKAIHNYTDHYATYSEIYWQSKPPNGTNPGGYDSYVRLVADKDNKRLRLELVVPKAGSAVIAPLTDWH